jgi:tetratricopeptide (TPR) repeat protein
MNNIETFSKYLSDLAKEKKYQNVLVNFKNNSSDFTKEEIRANVSIVKNIIDANRHEKMFVEAEIFIKIHDIEINASQNKSINSSYLWLLHYQLEYLIVKDDIGAVKHLLDRINSTLDSMDLTSEYYDMPVLFLLKKTVSIKRISPQTAMDQIARLLKSIQIKTNPRLREAIKNDSFTSSGIASLFGKAGHPDRGFRFLKYIGASAFAESAGEELLNSYGWLLYYKLKEENKDVNDEQPEENMDTMFVDFEKSDDNIADTSQSLSKEQTDEDILKILPILKTDSKFSPFSMLFNLYLKIEKKKPNTNWNKIYNLLQLLDVNSLSLHCRTVTFKKFGKEKVAELASDREIWFSFCCNALFQLKEFEQCLEISKNAFDIIPKFHYNNEIWLSRKISLCKRELGDLDDAIQGLEIIVRRKAEWFIQKEIAELYLEKGNISNSKKLAMAAALNRDEREKKDGLFLLLGKIFLQEGDKITSYKHFLLALLVRQELQYKIPQTLKDLLKEANPEKEIGSYEDSEVIYRELQRFWKSLSHEDSPHDPRRDNQLKGKIVKLVEAKRIGFILGNNGHEYFFHFNDYRGAKPEINLVVYFRYKKPDNPEKKWIAFDIHS